ncbi:calcium-binding protein [Azospirillum sp.]|uniref:calcium-binding protein n=1 Tax=Azospirillum sp. TaxID=34012 RepID=UPI003D73B45C
MASPFTVNNWTVTTLGAESADPVVNVTGTSGSVRLSPSFVDSAPVTYVFKDNLPNDIVSNDLRFDLDLRVRNASDFAVNQLTVDTLTMPPTTHIVNDVNALHPTLAHFHPAAAPTPGTYFDYAGYKTGTNENTGTNLNGANHVYLTGTQAGWDENTGWGASKVHHWDGQFALITTPVPIGDFGGMFDGLKGGPHFTWKSVWYATTEGQSYTGETFEDLAYGQAGDNLMAGGYGRDGLVGGEGNDTLNGEQDGDFLWGQTGDDSLNGGVGRDWLDGGPGNDTLNGDYDGDWMAGGPGDDLYYVNDDADAVQEFIGGGYDRVIVSTLYYSMSNWVEEATLEHSAGRDVSGNETDNVINGNGFNNTFYGLSGNDRMSGEDGADWMEGGFGNDTLVGGPGDDTLDGGDDADTLEGGSGKDQLTGGLGTDQLTGHEDADRFVFLRADEIGKGLEGDTVTDFSQAQGDTIELKGIDANTASVEDDAFSYIGDQAFTGVAGQLRFVDGTLQGDVDGDSAADFELHLVGVPSLAAADLIL